jgi:hypothetical protein
LGVGADDFLEFCESAIAARESSKFNLSKHVSAILEQVRLIGEAFGFQVGDMSHVKIDTIRNAYLNPGNLREEIERDILEGTAREALSHAAVLPPLIRFPSEVKMFPVSEIEANFVTLLSSSGPIVYLNGPLQDIEGKFVLVESADPGYDWIFTRAIKGLITCWGGANSHMAIRAKELGLPTAIGVGESLFLKLKHSAASIHLDCRNRRLEIIS